MFDHIHGVPGIKPVTSACGLLTLILIVLMQRNVLSSLYMTVFQSSLINNSTVWQKLASSSFKSQERLWAALLDSLLMCFSEMAVTSWGDLRGDLLLYVAGCSIGGFLQRHFEHLPGMAGDDRGTSSTIFLSGMVQSPILLLANL
jgi:hypothetical protein